MTDMTAVSMLSDLQRTFDSVVIVGAATAVARTGVADHIRDDLTPIAEVAAAAGVDALALRRVLRALETYGAFVIEGDAVRATELGALLRRASPLWSTAASMGAFDVMHALDHSLRTGESAWEHVHGATFWDWLSARPEQERIFADAMRGQGAMVSAAAVRHLDLAGVTTIADIGGGVGHLLAQILDAHPDRRGILVDLPSVLEGAVVDPARCTLHPGDLFGALPAADAYVLSRVLHDWSDADCERILRGIRRAAPTGARLFDIDFVVPPGPEPHQSKLADVNMLLLFGGGRERTRDEFDALFASTGWRLDDVTELEVSALLQATAVEPANGAPVRAI